MRYLFKDIDVEVPAFTFEVPAGNEASLTFNKADIGSDAIVIKEYMTGDTVLTFNSSTDMATEKNILGAGWYTVSMADPTNEISLGYISQKTLEIVLGEAP